MRLRLLLALGGRFHGIHGIHGGGGGGGRVAAAVMARGADQAARKHFLAELVVARVHREFRVPRVKERGVQRVVNVAGPQCQNHPHNKGSKKSKYLKSLMGGL